MFSSIKLFLLFFSCTTFAATHTARIVKLENSADVYVPGENKQSGLKHIKYLDQVFHIVPAAKGFKLENGYVLTTGPTSKAKIIYNNGDHVFVAENTQLKIDWQKPTGVREDPSTINLLRGAIRGLVEKDGPRSGMKVLTKSAVMGIRGTDFHVSEQRGSLNLSVLRGEVEILNGPENKSPVKVQSGQTLIKENDDTKVLALSKEDLRQIAKETSISVTPETVAGSDAEELKELEKKATAVTLGDIKEYQPQLYQQLSKLDQ